MKQGDTNRPRLHAHTMTGKRLLSRRKHGSSVGNSITDNARSRGKEKRNVTSYDSELLSMCKTIGHSRLIGHNQVCSKLPTTVPSSSAVHTHNDASPDYPEIAPLAMDSEMVVTAAAATVVCTTKTPVIYADDDATYEVLSEGGIGVTGIISPDNDDDDDEMNDGVPDLVTRKRDESADIDTEPNILFAYAGASSYEDIHRNAEATILSFADRLRQRLVERMDKPRTLYKVGEIAIKSSGTHNSDTLLLTQQPVLQLTLPQSDGASKTTVSISCFNNGEGMESAQIDAPLAITATSSSSSAASSTLTDIPPALPPPPLTIGNGNSASQSALVSLSSTVKRSDVSLEFQQNGVGASGNVSSKKLKTLGKTTVYADIQDIARATSSVFGGKHTCGPECQYANLLDIAHLDNCEAFQSLAEVQGILKKGTGRHRAVEPQDIWLCVAGSTMHVCSGKADEMCDSAEPDVSSAFYVCYKTGAVYGAINTAVENTGISRWELNKSASGMSSAFARKLDDDYARAAAIQAATSARTTNTPGNAIRRTAMNNPLQRAADTSAARVLAQQRGSAPVVAAWAGLNLDSDKKKQVRKARIQDDVLLRHIISSTRPREVQEDYDHLLRWAKDTAIRLGAETEFADGKWIKDEFDTWYNFAREIIMPFVTSDATETLNSCMGSAQPRSAYGGPGNLDQARIAYGPGSWDRACKPLGKRLVRYPTGSFAQPQRSSSVNNATTVADMAALSSLGMIVDDENGISMDDDGNMTATTTTTTTTSGSSSSGTGSHSITTALFGSREFWRGQVASNYMRIIFRMWVIVPLVSKLVRDIASMRMQVLVSAKQKGLKTSWIPLPPSSSSEKRCFKQTWRPKAEIPISHANKTNTRNEVGVVPEKTSSDLSSSLPPPPPLPPLPPPDIYHRPRITIARLQLIALGTLQTLANGFVISSELNLAAAPACIAQISNILERNIVFAACDHFIEVKINPTFNKRVNGKRRHFTVAVNEDDDGVVGAPLPGNSGGSGGGDGSSNNGSHSKSLSTTTQLSPSTMTNVYHNTTTTLVGRQKEQYSSSLNSHASTPRPRRLQKKMLKLSLHLSDGASSSAQSSSHSDIGYAGTHVINVSKMNSGSCIVHKCFAVVSLWNRMKLIHDIFVKSMDPSIAIKDFENGLELFLLN